VRINNSAPSAFSTRLSAALAVATLLVGAGAAPESDTATTEAKESSAIATFAGGCFWCMEPPFDALDGVISTTSGYTGGHQQNPTYKEVSRGGTGHTEALQIVYDPKQVSYAELLDVYWHNIDPTDPHGQFCDKGDQYRSEIFYHDDEQQKLADQSKAALVELKRFTGDVVTGVTAATVFYPAEDYHQDYYRKNPVHYNRYRLGCGRDHRLKDLWGDSGH